MKNLPFTLNIVRVFDKNLPLVCPLFALEDTPTINPLITLKSNYPFTLI